MKMSIARYFEERQGSGTSIAMAATHVGNDVTVLSPIDPPKAPAAGVAVPAGPLLTVNSNHASGRLVFRSGPDWVGSRVWVRTTAASTQSLIVRDGTAAANVATLTAGSYLQMVCTAAGWQIEMAVIA